MQKVTAKFERIPWVDICRGIAIILVLYGHALSNDTQRFIIYAFHMPLFFFLSGIVFRQDKTKNFLHVIWKNTKAILIPYVIFALLTLVVSYIILQPQVYTYESLTKQLYGIFYGNGNKGYLAYNVALWFLPCLFLAKISFALLTRIATNNKIIIAILLLSSWVGYYFSALLTSQKLFFGLEIAFTAIVFFGAGYLWNQNEKLKTLMAKRKVSFFVLAAFITILFAWLNFHFYGYQIDMRLNRLNNYFLFYIAAFSGIAMALLLSMMIRKNAVLEYFGKHSMLLFVWHTMLFSYFRMHGIPPIKIAYVSPVIYLLQAAGIILACRLLIEKLKLKVIYKKVSAKE